MKATIIIETDNGETKRDATVTVTLPKDIETRLRDMAREELLRHTRDTGGD